MAKPALLPDPTGLHLKLLDASLATSTVVVATTSEEAVSALSSVFRTNSLTLWTPGRRSPRMGWTVKLELHTRRFFCLNLACSRQIFAERLPNVVAPSARRTTRLTDVFTRIGFAPGGEAGKRLAAGMGLATSPDTLLWKRC